MKNKNLEYSLIDLRDEISILDCLNVDQIKTAQAKLNKYIGRAVIALYEVEKSFADLELRLKNTVEMRDERAQERDEFHAKLATSEQHNKDLVKLDEYTAKTLGERIKFLEGENAKLLGELSEANRKRGVAEKAVSNSLTLVRIERENSTRIAEQIETKNALKTFGSISEAAKALGISRAQLARRMKKYNLKKTQGE